METIEIAVEKEAFESTILHVLSKVMPDLLEELLLAIPSTEAGFLGSVVRSRMLRDDGESSDVLVPFSADVAAFLRSFSPVEATVNLDRSILVSDVRVRGIHAEPWDQHMALLRESIDRELPDWPDGILPLTFQRSSSVPGATFEESLIDRLFERPRRRFPSQFARQGSDYRETASTVDVPVSSGESECRIRVAIDVFLSASKEPTDPVGFEPMSVVQGVFFDFRAHAKVETADSNLLETTQYFRALDGTLVRAPRARRERNPRVLGVPAVVPFTSLALTLDRLVLDSEKPLAYRDSSLRRDIGTGRSILLQDNPREDFFGYLCFGSRARSVLPEFDGIISLVQTEVSTRLQRDLNDILCELYDELLDLGGPLHGVNLSPHYPRDDERASRPVDHSDRSNDCRFFLDERWFIWYFGVAVTPSQVRINIQLAQPSAFGWRPRQYCGLPTETLADCYPRVRVSNDILDPLQVSIERWTRFFSNPDELPLSRRVTVRTAYEFVASLLSRLIDEVLDYGLSMDFAQARHSSCPSRPPVLLGRLS